jgi:glyoxylase-like metal-dependent hydrolase (beta-lactamase superfamily II)
MIDQRPDQVTGLEPGIRRLIANNPSAMTYWGTNTYIVGEGQVGVIDPGPAHSDHMRAIMEALAPGETITHIFVTHSHLDHSPLARPLAQATGAPVLAFGNSSAGRSALMQGLVQDGLAGGGEGVDLDFAPDETLPDGSEVSGQDWSLGAIWTPGHMANHLCFSLGDAVFSGDHIMGWASSLVSPPDGDLTAFMASTEKLAARGDRVFYPGHGQPVADPRARTSWLIDHRRNREAAILTALLDGPADVASLTAHIYTDVDPRLIGAAQRNVFAHLIDLIHHSRVSATPALTFSANFSIL